VLTAVGLLPAAVLGIDVVKMLQGARKMTEYFKAHGDLQTNVVLQFAGVGHLLEKKGVTTRVLSVWGKRLEAFGLWYDQLLAESLGKERQGATPLTSVNTRDLHSRQQQHQQGRQDKLFTNLVVEQVCDDMLTVGHSDVDDDDLNRYAARTLPEILNIAVQATDEALHSDGQPTATLSIPRLDENTLGQLFQMMMLATSAEGAMMGVNPYGQPGVEIYKRNMKRLLEE
jgi:glucose-6-phosphate isomerase